MADSVKNFCYECAKVVTVSELEEHILTHSKRTMKDYKMVYGNRPYRDFTKSVTSAPRVCYLIPSIIFMCQCPSIQVFCVLCPDIISLTLIIISVILATVVQCSAH